MDRQGTVIKINMKKKLFAIAIIVMFLLTSFSVMPAVANERITKTGENEKEENNNNAVGSITIKKLYFGVCSVVAAIENNYDSSKGIRVEFEIWYPVGGRGSVNLLDEEKTLTIEPGLERVSVLYIDAPRVIIPIGIYVSVYSQATDEMLDHEGRDGWWFGFWGLMWHGPGQ